MKLTRSQSAQNGIIKQLIESTLLLGPASLKIESTMTNVKVKICLEPDRARKNVCGQSPCFQNSGIYINANT